MKENNSNLPVKVDKSIEKTDLYNQVVDFLKSKISDNLELSMTINKDKKSGRVHLTFDAHYDDKEK